MKSPAHIIEANESKPILIAYNYKHDRDRIKSRFNAKEILSEEDIKYLEELYKPHELVGAMKKPKPQ